MAPFTPWSGIGPRTERCSFVQRLSERAHHPTDTAGRGCAGPRGPACRRRWTRNWPRLGSNEVASIPATGAPASRAGWPLVSGHFPTSVGSRHLPCVRTLKPAAARRMISSPRYPQGRQKTSRCFLSERTSDSVDHSPFVYLRAPIRTRGTRTFRAIGGAAERVPSEPSPPCTVPPGSPRGKTPRL